MRNYIYPLFTLLSIFGLFSCEKTIEIDVDESSIKPVIEARLSNHLGESFVLLHYSQNLYDTTPYDPITTAEVYIKDLQDNLEYRLLQESEGIYYNSQLVGEPGKDYKLTVQMTDGSEFTSIGEMPLVTPLDDINYELADDALQDDEDENVNLYKITPVFTDIAGIENYYQLMVKKEYGIQNNIFVFKDLGFDGLLNTQRIYLEAQEGDTLYMQLQNLNKSTYNYFYGVVTNINQGSGTPTNAISNINGDVFGYFKVYSYDKEIEVIID